MEIQMSKGRSILFLIALFLTTIASAGELVIMPITNNFYQYFPESTNVVNFILSGPSLIMILMSLLVPYVIKLIGQKNTLLAGCVLFTVSGILGLQILEIPYIILWRMVNAISQAIVNVTAIVIITSVYTDQQKCATITGLYTAVLSLTCALMSAASGFLAAQTWTNAFFTYWAGVPMIILAILFIPKLKKTESPDSGVEIEQVNKSKEPMGTKFWIYVGVMTFYYISYCVPAYFSSVYIAEHNLGTEALSGMALSVANIAAMLSGLIFGFIFSKGKNKTAMYAYLLLAISIALMYFFPSRAMVLIGNFIAGSTMSVIYAFSFTFAPSLVPESKKERAISVVTALSVSGQFVATYFVTWLMGSVFKTELVTPIYIVPAVIMVAAGIIEGLSRTKDSAGIKDSVGI